MLAHPAVKPLLRLLLLLLLPLAVSSAADVLDDAKAAVKKKYEGPETRNLLEEVPSGRMEVKPAAAVLPTSEVAANGAVITVLKDDTRKEHQRGSTLTYPSFRASVVKFPGGKDYDSLPAAWGADDFAKIGTVMRTSGKSIDSAKTIAELEDIVVRLTAKGTIAPLGASLRLDWIEGPGYEGWLCGDFKQATKMSLLVRPKGKLDISYRIDLSAPNGSDREILKDFLSTLKITLKE